MSQPMPALIGHRGLPLLAPENTAASVRCAAEHKIEWIEVDVTMAGDGTLVMMHDLTLKRFGQPGEALIDQTEASLRTVDAGSWFSAEFAGEPLLMFDEFLILADQLALNINLEIKTNPDLPLNRQIDTIWQTIQANPLQNSKLIVSSFELQTLRRLRELSETIHIGVLFENLPEDIDHAIDGLNPVAIHCDHSTLTQQQAQAVRQRWPLYCYTVNDSETLEKLLSWGVVGVFCDRAHAEELRSVVNNHSAAQNNEI